MHSHGMQNWKSHTNDHQNSFIPFDRMAHWQCHPVTSTVLRACHPEFKISTCRVAAAGAPHGALQAAITPPSPLMLVNAAVLPTEHGMSRYSKCLQGSIPFHPWQSAMPLQSQQTAAYSIRATRAAAAMLIKPAAAVAALLGALGVAMVSLAAGASRDAVVALPAGTSAGSSPGAAALAVALASVAV
jgi:hypothetical protein